MKTVLVCLVMRLAFIAVTWVFLSAGSAAESEKPKDKGPPGNPTVNSHKEAEKKPVKKPGGAELYGIHCTRCHPARYGTERTPEQWKTLMLHMRTRANLPAAQARAILQYLQQDAGK